MNVPFSFQPLLAACALGVFLWDRSRIRSRLSSLSKRQSNIDSTLNQFIQECERALHEFSDCISLTMLLGSRLRLVRVPSPITLAAQDAFRVRGSLRDGLN